MSIIYMLEYLIRLLFILWNHSMNWMKLSDDKFCITCTVWITTMLIIMLHANLFVILYFHDFNVVDLLWFILIISLLIWLWLDYSQSEISLKICMNNSWHALFWISCRYMPIEKGMQLLVTQLKFLWLVYISVYAKTECFVIIK